MDKHHFEKVMRVVDESTRATERFINQPTDDNLKIMQKLTDAAIVALRGLKLNQNKEDEVT